LAGSVNRLVPRRTAEYGLLLLACHSPRLPLE
jgi:hypothetical protein